MRCRWLIAGAVGLAALPATACSSPPQHVHLGLVVDEHGDPVPGASVRIGDEEVRTSTDGRYELDAATEQAWVAVGADGHLNRTRASAADDPVLVRLTSEARDTVSIHFTGDVMAGRRFYDRDEDGDTEDGQLGTDASVEEHAALLEDIRPLLGDADLTVINLETPLTEDPWYDVNGKRPPEFHPTKDFAFSSHPRFARALLAAGVDVVNLGNNHLYDRLEGGVEQTIETLEDIGLTHYGAGSTVEEAWRPAIVRRKGQAVAFLGCTSILGDEHPIPYVAGEDQGGAAPCEPALLEGAVRDAAARFDAVVLSVHGGFEYGAEPSRRVASLTQLATEAGAALVVNHHPHVLGGLEAEEGAVVAENLGNFLFDQTIWQTFPGAIFRADLRRGEVVRALAEPIVLADYRPRGLLGAGSAHVQRIVAGLGGDRAVMESGAVELQLDTPSGFERRTVSTDAPLVRVADALALVDVSGSSYRLGRDVLRVGDFEDHQVGEDESHWSFWELQPGREIREGTGRDGSAGATIERRPSDGSDTYFNPRHRILLDAGRDLTFTGWLRGEGTVEALVQLSWYPDTKGPSSEQTVERIRLDGPREDGWSAFRIDATAPANAVAVGALVRLPPPEEGRATLRIDDLALISWADPGSMLDARYDHLRLDAPATVTLEARHLPGGAPWSAAAVDGRVLRPTG